METAEKLFIQDRKRQHFKRCRQFVLPFVKMNPQSSNFSSIDEIIRKNSVKIMNLKSCYVGSKVQKGAVVHRFS